MDHTPSSTSSRAIRSPASTSETNTSLPLNLIASEGVGPSGSGRRSRRGPLVRACERLKEALHEYGKGFADQMDAIRDYARAPLIAMERSLEALERYVARRKATWRWYLWPDFHTVVLDVAAKAGRRVVEGERQTVGRFLSVLDQATRSDRYESVGLIMANSPVVRELLGANEDALAPVRNAWSEVIKERRNLQT